MHGPWRRLFSSDAFSYSDGLTHQERTALSYERLRLVNEAIDNPLDLAAEAASLSALHEWMGAADGGLTTIASIHYNLFLGSLLDHDHDGRDLGEFTRMERVGTFLCTERGHGNAAVQLETTATFDRESGGFVLNTPTADACKWMPNTSSLGGPKSALVAARLVVDGADHGVFLFLTPLHDDAGSPMPGVEIHPLPQVTSSPVDHCATSFHDVRLPYEALLQGDHGRLTRSGEFSSSLGSPRKRFLRSIGRVTMGKLCMSAGSLSLMRQALAVAMQYAHQRFTSGMTKSQTVPLIAHRSHHAPLLDAVATTYAATLLQRKAVQRWERITDADREETERLLAISKGWITWQARAVLTECRERCGAQGLLLPNGIAGQLAGNEGTITAEGDNRVIWVKAAGEMLLGGFTPKPASEIPPESRQLDDPHHLQDLLADIERIWCERARIRLRAGRGGSGLARWNATVTPALELVEAHAHRLAAEALLAGAGERLSAEPRQLLQDLHRLFALRRVAVGSGDLLANGRLTAEQVQQIPDAIEATIGALEPYSLTLTDAFAIPEALLANIPLLQQSGLAAR
ncbi:acyl-CoA dehydrogenase [Streptomyces sp. NPDC046994]|uniref:acyl-CoA dehydrogenase family protein n=1 Tax=Streptomyces sp. NPDC046994 TaxID=3155735 RepID=UPI0034529E05